MRRVAKGISTIETLVLVGLLGMVLLTSLNSYRSYLLKLEDNFTTIDFDHTVELIEKEFRSIKDALEVKSTDLKLVSHRLDTADEWFELVNSKIELNTKNILITSLDGSIEGNNLVIGVGSRVSDRYEQKSQLICWESASSDCLVN